MKLKIEKPESAPPLLEVKEGKAGKLKKLPYPNRPKKVKLPEKHEAPEGTRTKPLFLERREGEIRYRSQPEVSPVEKPKGSNWEKLVDEIYPKPPTEQDGQELEQDLRVATEGAEKVQAFHNALDNILLGLEPGSPLIHFLEKDVLAKKESNAETKEADPFQTTATVVLYLFETIYQEQKLTEDLKELPTESRKAKSSALAHLNSLLVKSRLKTEFRPKPLFLGLKASLELNPEEVKIIEDLNELQLLFFEALAGTLINEGLLTDHPLVQLFYKLKQIDDTPESIYQECRAGLISIYPYWHRDEQEGLLLEKYLRDHGQDKNNDSIHIVSPVGQADFLLSLKAAGTRLPAGLEKGGVALHMTGPVGRVIENLVLPDGNGLPRNQEQLAAKKFLLGLLAPFKHASQKLGEHSAAFTTPAELSALFEKDEVFHPLIDQTAELLAAAYLKQRGIDLVEVDEEQEKLTYPYPGQNLFLQLEKLAGRDASHIIDSFPNFYGPQSVKNPGENQAAIENVATELKTHHYQDVLRCVLLFVILANLLEEKELIQVPGKIIKRVRLSRFKAKEKAAPDQENSEEKEVEPEAPEEEEMDDVQADTCDAIVLPENFKPMEANTHRLENIVGEEKTPLSIIEIKSLLSLWQTHPPKALRRAKKSITVSDEKQVSNWRCAWSND